MPVETINVVKIKKQAEAVQEAQKLNDKKEKSMKVKIMKTRPVNNPANVITHQQQPMDDGLIEYKATPSIALVEAFSRGMPNFCPANAERLRHRLLASRDLAILMDRVFMNYEVHSDKLKLLMTLGFHLSNEVLETMMSDSARAAPPKPSVSQAQPVAGPSTQSPSKAPLPAQPSLVPTSLQPS